MTRKDIQRRRREVERELRLLRHDLDNRIGALLSELMQIQAAEVALEEHHAATRGTTEDSHG